jgi:tetratricopeptide (TPR) repeat protein
MADGAQARVGGPRAWVAQHDPRGRSTNMTVADFDDAVGAPTLIEEAERAYLSADYTRSADLSKQAVALARRHNDKPSLGRALVTVSRLAAIAGENLPAYEAAAEAYRLLRDGGDIAHQLLAINALSSAYHHCNDHASCVDWLKRGLQLAVGPEHVSTRSLLLVNMAVVLHNAHEYAAAIEHLEDAASGLPPLPHLADRKAMVVLRLAIFRLHHARRLRDQGFEAEAERQRQSALADLPPLPAAPWRAATRRDMSCFTQQAELRAELGQWPAARFAAAAGIRFARCRVGAVVDLALGLASATHVHRSQGRLDLAIRSEERALAKWRSADIVSGVWDSLERLSEILAAAGDHRRALALRKEADGLRGRQRREAAGLRCRLAVIERSIERRHREVQEAAAHAQRLALIGRLIAQTHHALSTPITRIRQLADQALLAGHDTHRLRPLLAQTSQTIDDAAGLVSQLKLFSYRSSPQPMVLSLHRALLDAWKGLDAHTGSCSAELRVGGLTRLQVWADAQRLGIMLKLLLIELTRQECAHGAPLLLIDAQVSSGDNDTAVLDVQAGGCREAAGAQTAHASLGTALCMEIAAEMNGELRHSRGDGGGLQYMLWLPQHEAPQTGFSDDPMLRAPGAAAH